MTENASQLATEADQLRETLAQFETRQDGPDVAEAGAPPPDHEPYVPDSGGAQEPEDTPAPEALGEEPIDALTGDEDDGDEDAGREPPATGAEPMDAGGRDDDGDEDAVADSDDGTAHDDVPTVGPADVLDVGGSEDGTEPPEEPEDAEDAVEGTETGLDPSGEGDTEDAEEDLDVLDEGAVDEWLDAEESVGQTTPSDEDD